MEVNLLHIDDLDKISAELPYDALVAIGGDGTVNAVAKCAYMHKKPMGVIPRGSGNGLARHLGLDGDLKQALEVLRNGEQTQVDVAWLNDQLFLNIAGSGFEAEIAHNFEKQGRSRGYWGYVRTILRRFRKAKMIPCTVKVDGENQEFKYFTLCFANGSQWGNDFKIASQASLKDGILEMAVMKKPAWYSLPFLFAYLRSSRHNELPNLRYFRGSTFEISTSSDTWHVDGEPLTVESPLTVRVEASALSIFVPHG